MYKPWFMVVLLTVCPGVQAGMVQAVVGGGASKASGSWIVKGQSATAANGAFVTPATVTAAGKQVTMPASASYAANAAAFAVSAVRLNPTGLLLTAVVPWLLTEGLQWANNSWTKTTPGNELAEFRVIAPFYSAIYNRPVMMEAFVAMCSRSGGNGVITNYVESYSSGNVTGGTARCNHWGENYTAVKACTNGASVTNGLCPNAAPTVAAATDADFAPLSSAPLPDAVAQQLARADVPIPVNEPVLSSSPVQSDSTPYLDPLSGRLVTERSVFTPSPTAQNPQQVRIENYQVDAGNVPGQTQAAPAPTKEANISNQPLDIKFPSDYARQGEAATAAQSITDSLGPKIDKITETGADPENPVQPQGSEFDQAFFQGTFTNLLGWQLPAHTSQCPTSDFTFNSTSYTIDSHCQLVANHFSALSAVMSAVWTILALFILLGA